MKPKQSTRITLVLADLGCGGVQRVVLTLAQGLAARGYDLTVVTLSDHAPDFFPLPPGISRASVPLRTRRRRGVLNFFRNAVGRLQLLPRVLATAKCETSKPFA
jgi:Glycosyltransferase Family 4